MRGALLLLTMLMLTRGSAQTLQWVDPIQGPYHSPVMAMCSDSSGDLYCTGFYQGDSDFDPGPGTFMLPAPGAGVYIFVAKYAPGGGLLWAERFSSGTGFIVYGTNIATNDTGALYVAGQFSGASDFDPGAGTWVLDETGLDAYYETDVFAMKLNGAGALSWAVQIGDSAADYCRDMVVDADGNTILAIQVRDTVDMDPGPGSDTLYNVFPQESVLMKLDANGALLWYRDLGQSESYVWMSLGVDGTGNIWVATNLHLRKYDPSGTLLLDLPLQVVTTDLAMDAGGNVYLSGSFVGSVDVDPGTGVLNMTAAGWSDLFCTKLDPNGDLLWAVQLGAGGQTAGWGVEHGEGGRVYLTGSYENSIDLDPGPGSWMTTVGGGQDVLVVCLDSLGVFQEAMTLNGPGDQSAYDCLPTGPSEWVVHGGFEQTVDFDPGGGVFPLSSVAYSDGFMAKYQSATSSMLTTFEKPGLQVTPMPCADEALLSGIPADAGEMILFNSFGQRILRAGLAGSSAEVVLNLGDLPDGWYALQLSTGSGALMVPILISR